MVVRAGDGDEPVAEPALRDQPKLIFASAAGSSQPRRRERSETG
jgi:hypothetical protein